VRPAAGLQTSGDPRAGLSVFKFESCPSCHAIAGISVGRTGKSLDGEGRRRSASWLRAMRPAHLRTTARRPLAARDLGDLISYLTSLR
jgi:mono/diheme cytochrome c family protein